MTREALSWNTGILFLAMFVLAGCICLLALPRLVPLRFEDLATLRRKQPLLLVELGKATEQDILAVD
jgi:hypothetical protein